MLGGSNVEANLQLTERGAGCAPQQRDGATIHWRVALPILSSVDNRGLVMTSSPLGGQLALKAARLSTARISWIRGTKGP